MKDYTPFAWEKCHGQRGLSAIRSIDHFKGWCWLLEDDEALAFISNDDNYSQYGALMLAYLCERYGFPVVED